MSTSTQTPPTARSRAPGTIVVAFLGDIYGSPGRKVVQQQLPNLRRDYSPDVVIANAENARSGSGLSPDLYHKIRASGVDAVTLGDHTYRDARIRSILEQTDEPILRPANLSSKAVGRQYIRISASMTSLGKQPTKIIRNLYVITVLGRIFMSLPVNDPFATVDELLESLPERDPLVIVEAHMEATSEKNALARYLDGRVAAVVGTHTHVPTADTRILPKGTGYQTDLGMCGPYESIIGASIEPVLRHMTTGMHSPYSVGSGDERLCGVVLTLDAERHRTVKIERVEYAADASLPPFAAHRG
jgi:2',3'-cyclic-nucleotide 2'-phosphodiesterase